LIFTPHWQSDDLSFRRLDRIVPGHERGGAVSFAVVSPFAGFAGLANRSGREKGALFRHHRGA
jgi:hypothetical protein